MDLVIAVMTLLPLFTIAAYHMQGGIVTCLSELSYFHFCDSVYSLGLEYNILFHISQSFLLFFYVEEDLGI